MALAAQTSQALDAEHARSGAKVVLIGRAGQDLGKYGLRYSHLGWAYKTPEGPWRVTVYVRPCSTPASIFPIDASPSISRLPTCPRNPGVSTCPSRWASW